MSDNSKLIYMIFLLLIIVTGGGLWGLFKRGVAMDENTKLDVATLAGGCFWCVESDLEKIDGVVRVISGFSGGDELNPTYEQVASGATGHREAVQIFFDPQRIDYAQILDAFLKHIDPTDNSGSFVDKGFQYTSAIFVHDGEQRRIAKAAIQKLIESERYSKPVVISILDFKNFYPADEHHQNYFKKNPVCYMNYRSRSGRDDFIREIWGDETGTGGDMLLKSIGGLANIPTKKTSKELAAILTPLQYNVVCENGTEQAFDNEYWNNMEEGIYVDIVSGEPLFSSTDKFKSGTGWPSFTKPIVSANVIERADDTLALQRTEVRSKSGDSHLGHLFSDGPKPTGLRYCINSASLRFIKKADLVKEGYGEFLELFDNR